MVSTGLFITQRVGVGVLSASQPKEHPHPHRQWQHYLANVDDMTRPLRATNKQTITSSRAPMSWGEIKKNAQGTTFPSHTLKSAK